MSIKIFRKKIVFLDQILHVARKC